MLVFIIWFLILLPFMWKNMSEYMDLQAEYQAHPENNAADYK